jgi:hypothetical protein
MSTKTESPEERLPKVVVVDNQCRERGSVTTELANELPDHLLTESLASMLRVYR